MANFSNAYTSMSGIDLTAVFGNIIIGTLQGISYSITREKAPVYTFGSANPRSFSRGKRGIAGSCVFTLFDRASLDQLVQSDDTSVSSYYAHEHEPASTFHPDINKDVFELYGRINSNTNRRIATTPRKAEYADQLMPFDVTLVAQNEYGLSAFMVIVGLEILNEGGGLSVDDITNEEQMTYVARGKSPWIPTSPIDATQGRKPGTSVFEPQSSLEGRRFFIPENFRIDELGNVVPITT